MMILDDTSCSILCIKKVLKTPPPVNKTLLKSLIKRFKEKNKNFFNSNKQQTSKWWEQIGNWREKKSLNFINSNKIIKPQHAVQRLYELTKHQDTFITTEVGQHQMWEDQH